jgi:hypothetical protein
MDFITHDVLRRIFNEEEYVIVYIPEKSAEPPPTRRQKTYADASASFTPFSTALLASATPGTSRRELAAALRKDDAAVQAQEEISDLDDPNYKFFNSSDVGIKLEYWVCANMRCPGCTTGVLYKYQNPNMPAVDVICTNPNHTLQMGPKFYQIKTTLSGTYHEGRRYFSKKDRYICVGSYKYGYNCHVMRPDNPNIDILIGYICIEYNIIKDNDIKIINTNSFILIPNLLYKPTTDTYYEYISIPPNNITVIEFKPDMFEIRDIPSKIIDLNVNYKTIVPVKNIALLKYLIMKKKYLDLKKSLFLDN